MLSHELCPKDCSGIRGGLRQAFTRSEYMKEFKDSKKIYTPWYKKDGSRAKIDRVHIVCEVCHGEVKQDRVYVDHIEPVGSLKSLEEVPVFLVRLYCSYDNLQCLCKSCHDEKTELERLIKYWL